MKYLAIKILQYIENCDSLIIWQILILDNLSIVFRLKKQIAEVWPTPHLQKGWPRKQQLYSITWRLPMVPTTTPKTLLVCFFPSTYDPTLTMKSISASWMQRMAEGAATSSVYDLSSPWKINCKIFEEQRMSIIPLEVCLAALEHVASICFR